MQIQSSLSQAFCIVYLESPWFQLFCQCKSYKKKILQCDSYMEKNSFFLPCFNSIVTGCVTGNAQMVYPVPEKSLEAIAARDIKILFFPCFLLTEI